MDSSLREPFVHHRYRVLRQLGAGAMGTVHLVADTQDENEPLALKTIRQEFVSAYGHSAFKKEFQAMTTLHHPNLVEVYEFGTLARTRGDFFTMEYVEGQNLLDACRGADLDTLYDYFTQVGRALEYIHAQGFIHFDLKPDNIMVRRDGTVKVMDFGLVEKASFNQSSVLKGTVHYLAPEMLRGEHVDHRLDLYAMGAVLVHVLTGRTLFEGTLEQVMFQHLHQPPDLNLNGRRPIPECLRPLLQGLLDKEPTRRPASASEFLIELAQATGGARGAAAREVLESHVLGSRSVGRESELGRLKALFADRVLSPQPGLPKAAFVFGPLGSGKSRLVQELRHHVQLHRVRFHQGYSLQNGGQPYLAFAEILRVLARDILSEALYPLPTSRANRSAPINASGETGWAVEDTFTRPADGLPAAGAAAAPASPTATVAFRPDPINGRTAADSPPEVSLFGLEGGTAAALSPEDAAEARIASEQLAALLREHSSAVARIIGSEVELPAPTIPPLVFSHPEREKAWLTESICRFLIGVSRRVPLVLYFSDLHWADQLTLELVGQLTRELAESDNEEGPPARLLLCGCYRIEAPAPGAPVETNALDAQLGRPELAERIMLGPLSAPDVATMLSSMLGPVQAVRKVADVLVERTCGNPLFIEATVRNFLAAGAIVRERATWTFDPQALLSLHRAESAASILDPMITQLSPPERETLQLLAVFNRPVDVPLLSVASETGEKPLRERLSLLRKKRFVERGWGEGHHQYSLRHSALRDHLYQSMENGLRARLHDAAGSALEGRYGQTARFVEDLSEHFHLSGNLSKATHYARAAGDQAKKLYDFKRANAFYTRAHQAHRLLGADLAVSLAEVSLYSASEKHIERLKAALPLVEEVNDRVRLGQIQNWIGRMYYALGRQRDALQWFTQFMRTSEGTQDDFTRALPYAMVGRAFFFLGRFQAARTHLEKSIALLEGRAGSEEDLSYALGMGGSTCAYLGDLPHGQRMIHRSIALAEQIHHQTRIALGKIYMGIILAHYGKWDEATFWLEAGLEMCRKSGDVIGLGTGSSFRGLVALAQGNPGEAISLCRFGKEHIAKAGGTWTFTMIGAHLAEALLAQGEVAEAQRTAEEILPLIETGEHWGESCLYVALGKIFQKQRRPDTARLWLDRALSVAQAQEARPFVAKAQLALGAFLRAEGQSHAASEPIERARAAFEALSMPWYRDRCTALLSGGEIGPTP